MTEATRRPTLIPRWLAFALGAVAIAAVVLGAASLVTAPEAVSTPSVVGLEGPVARSRLAQLGLLLEYGDTRFSGDVPSGAVIEQDPPAGTEVPPGTVVVLVISAGSESFPMPDVVGMNVEAARGIIEPRGITVEVEVVSSDEAAGTVLESTPASGVRIDTGTTVRLVVAGEGGGDVLLPTDLTGSVVLLDPEPPEPGDADVTMEITRHVRALLQASGAEVLVTRSIIETQAPPAVRAAWASEASATIALGIGTGEGVGGVRTARTLPSSPDRAEYYLASVDLARLLVTELTAADQSASMALPEDDPVLDAAATQGARLLVGATDDPLNVETFSDPAWADAVARAIYRALAAALGG